MKDDLVGLIVGYDVPHSLHPSQVKDGDPLQTTRTEWGRVAHIPQGGSEACVVPIHSGNPHSQALSSIHTIATESYSNARR